MDIYFRHDYPNKIPDGMIPVCVYADTTELYSQEEVDECNLAYLLFPKTVVESYFQYVIAPYLENEMTFEQWFESEYIADDTDLLYDFAEGRNGFHVIRYTETNDELAQNL